MKSEHDVEPKRSLQPRQPCGEHELKNDNGEGNDRTVNAYFGKRGTMGPG
jgi:hypothetical protein